MLKKFTIVFKHGQPERLISAHQMNITEAFIAFPVFGENDEYSCISFALSEVWSVEESA